MCLGLTRSIILERRPVSLVAKAIGVLVTSYSLSIKTGSYFKGIRNENSPSDVSNASSPAFGSDISTSRIDTPHKFIRHESSAGVDNGSLNRSSTLPSSESEDTSSIDSQNRNPSYSQPGITKVDRLSCSNADISDADVQTSSLESQIRGPSDNAQLTSPAISPDEIYTFIFAVIDEEMVADPSYLISIIVEFVRRYANHFVSHIMCM